LDSENINEAKDCSIIVNYSDFSLSLICTRGVDRTCQGYRTSSR